MFKDKYLLTIIFIHVLVLSGIIWRSHHLAGERLETTTTQFENKLTSIVQTMAKVNPEGPISEIVDKFNKGITTDVSDPAYLRISNMYREILKVNELDDCELSFIVFEKDSRSLFRLVSSDPIYSSSELFHESHPDYLKRYSIGSAGLIELSESIWKMEVFKPVKNYDGETIGILRIESGNVKDVLEASSTLWLYVIPVAIYLCIAVVLTLILVRKRNEEKSSTSAIEVEKELRQKNNELKMLSLVAKKSENLMLISDEKGKILWVNETYETKNNYTAEELNEFTGKYLQDVSKNTHIKTIIKNVVDFKQAFTYESSSKDQSGETYYAMTTVSPVEDEKGTVSNLLFVDTDVTMVKRAQKENEVYKEFVTKSKLPRIHVTSNGVLRFSNPAASPVLQAWKNPNGKFKDDILAMLQGICDSGISQDIHLSVMSMNFKLNFHPNKAEQELFIIGESVSHLVEKDIDRPGEKRAG